MFFYLNSYLEYLYFSLLDIGYVQKKLKSRHWKEKWANLMFATVVLACCLGFLYQIRACSFKLMAKPTGVYLDTDSLAVNLSMTFCKQYDVSHGHINSDVLPALESVEYRPANEKGFKVLHRENSSSLKPFLWYLDNQAQIYLCKSIEVLGEEIKISHKYDHAEVEAGSRKIHVYLHETGDFGSGSQLKLNAGWLAWHNSVYLMQMVPIVQIPEVAMCSTSYQFSDCLVNLVTHGVYQKAGCVLRQMGWV